MGCCGWLSHACGLTQDWEVQVAASAPLAYYWAGGVTQVRRAALPNKANVATARSLRSEHPPTQ